MARFVPRCSIYFGLVLLFILGLILWFAVRIPVHQMWKYWERKILQVKNTKFPNEVYKLLWVLLLLFFCCWENVLYIPTLLKWFLLLQEVCLACNLLASVWGWWRKGSYDSSPKSIRIGVTIPEAGGLG